MDVNKLIQESVRILQNGGKLTIADVGGSNIWKFPGVKLIVRFVIFFYFSMVENKSRAWAEARAVNNVFSKEDWNLFLMKSGFQNIVIRKLKSKFFWVPSPLLICAEKKGD
jgi:SAM-dependent methyltransferase